MYRLNALPPALPARAVGKPTGSVQNGMRAALLLARGGFGGWMGGLTERKRSLYTLVKRLNHFRACAGSAAARLSGAALRFLPADRSSFDIPG
ncbi:hypothetical protein GCM10008961_16300 [Deinococcus knuensis]|uniref:Transposase DDE domain-containing protein n=1 Tax=Deinococcus knuensis TaxID=1837380 RepID=A0ABQ2SEX2_9DEIO|nr:hypothetical protein GCM10008961_16300 [Deinococcus knuensis]